jgi:hypothetical protein
MSGTSQNATHETGQQAHWPVALLLAALSVVSTAVLAGAAATAYFPAGYREWTVAKFKFESKGALRHHYANPQALASWGKFDDGSVIVDEKLHAKLGDDGTWREDGIAHVAVMRKDAKAYADTGGWYFNVFTANDTAVGMTPEQAKTRCFDACHKAQEARDYVFSDPRR